MSSAAARASFADVSHVSHECSIQEISRVLGIDRIKVQFWDCSGSAQYQSYWPVLAKVGLVARSQCSVELPRQALLPACTAIIALFFVVQEVDGLLMVIDPARPEQERELETFYRNFAEPNNLYTRQCMVMAIQIQREGAGLGGWQGKFGRRQPMKGNAVSHARQRPRWYCVLHGSC